MESVTRLLRTGSVLSALVLTVGIAGLSAQDEPENPASDYRTALMGSVQRHVGAIGALLSGAVEYEGHIAYHASAIHGIATMTADAFPAGTGGEGTRAKLEIWHNWADFQSKLESFRNDAAALDTAAQSGDMAAIGEAFQNFRGNCRSCHTDYRAPAN